MKWKKKIKIYPKEGDKRIILKFLLLPLCIDNEYRWLEKVKIEQKYIRKEKIKLGCCMYEHCWIDLRYID